MDVVGILLVAVFVAMMAAAVFGTAWLGVRLSGGHLGKTAAMVVAGGLWIGLIGAGYMLLGGENAFRDGYGLIVLVCVSVAVAAGLILRRWTRRPAGSADTGRV